jgi:NAD(P)-dependent dehydrogenase (short-subunit alcohol dehydrogenase family)
MASRTEKGGKHMNSAWTTAFLTGGGSGIGLRLAEMLAERKVHLAVFDLKISHDVQRRLSALAPGSVFHQVDVRDAEGLEAAVRTAVTEIGPPQLRRGRVAAHGIGLAAGAARIAGGPGRQLRICSL